MYHQIITQMVRLFARFCRRTSDFLDWGAGDIVRRIEILIPSGLGTSFPLALVSRQEPSVG